MKEFSGKSVSVKDAARIMGKDQLTVREGIIRGIFPIGSAFKRDGSSRYTFYISPKLLFDYTGYDITKEQVV